MQSVTKERIAKLVLLSMAVQSLVPLSALAQVQVDPAAPSSKKPVLDKAGNGVPIVHIAPANGAGVSHNLFTQFNVQTNGLVLNNSSAAAAAPVPAPPPPAPAPAPAPSPICSPRCIIPLTTPKTPALAQASTTSTVTTTSTIAGSIGGNPLFARNPAAEATLIVNEVTAANPTSLLGTMEVFGRQADVVIANPYGITCNGCGFINTTRASLVSGKPTWSGLLLDGFNVTGGAVAVGPSGLYSSSLSFLDLVAGRVSVNGSINLPGANSAIVAVVGPNLVNYATLVPTAQGRTDAKPALAIDVGAAGGMYANQIYMLATEQGAGVNSLGRLEARGGDLTLDAKGNLTLAGTLKASGSAVGISGPSVALSGATIQSQGSTLLRSAGDLTTSKVTIASQDAQFSAGGRIGLTDTDITSTRDVVMFSGGETRIQGGRSTAAGSTVLHSSGDLLLVPTLSETRQDAGSVTTFFKRYDAPYVTSGGAVSMQARNGVALLDGANVDAGDGIAIHGAGVAIQARKDYTEETNWTTYRTIRVGVKSQTGLENLVSARLTAANDISILASGDPLGLGNIFISGAQLSSKSGHVGMVALKDVDVAHDTTTDRAFTRFYDVKSNFFRTKTTEVIKSTVDETINPTLVEGKSLSVGAGGKLSVTGSEFLADGAIGMRADGDLNLLSTGENHLAFESTTVTRSGIFSNGGLSITIGSQSRTDIRNQQELRQHGSSIASLAGDVMLSSGGNYLQASSDVVAPIGDIQIAGRNVSMVSNSNTYSLLNIVRQKQTGLTLSASHPIVTTAQTVNEMRKLSKRTDSGRYQALALLTSGLTVYNQYRDLMDPGKFTSFTDAIQDAAKTGWTFSASLGTTQSSMQSVFNSTLPVESNVNAGRDVFITANGDASGIGDINLVGTKVSSGRNVNLRAARDVVMAAAIGKQTDTTKTQSSSAAVGLSFGVGGTQSGLAATFAASRSSGYSNGWGTSYFQTQVAAGERLHMTSGQNTILNGAKASGKSVVAIVGSTGAGNLNIVSPQDENHYVAKEQSYGINASIPIPGMGTGLPSFGLSASQLKLLADHESVREQSAIVAGSGGYDITVNGHTHLLGGAIASKADPSRNKFTTQTLNHETLVNKDVAEGRGWGVNIMVGNKGQDGLALGGSSVGYARIDTQQGGHTASSIAPGSLTITRPDLQAAQLSVYKTALREPYVATVNDLTNRLRQLRLNEPPRCDTCLPMSMPTDGGALKADATTTASSTSGTSLLVSPTKGSETMMTDYRWRSWYEAVKALEAQLAQAQARLAAVDAKTYQDVATLSRSADPIHQPLLHTFDGGKAQQELRDGVAVTSAFGKAAFKSAGDYAQDRYKQELKKCSSISNCPEADKWKDGGIYRTVLHMAVGGIGWGRAGVTGAGANAAMQSALDTAIVQLGITDPTAINVLRTAVGTMAGYAVGATPGAAAAFNADANNRQLHPNEIEWIKRNRDRFAAAQGITPEAAEERLAQQAFRQVQFGAPGVDDPAARAFFARYAPTINLPGDPTIPGMNTGFMFYASPEQRANAGIYLSAVLNNPAARDFYQRNNIVQPTIEQIIQAAGVDGATRDALKARTIQAGIAAAALVLTPAAAGIVTEAAEFASLGPVTYCMYKPQSCTVATEFAVCAVAGSACPTGSLAPQIRNAAAAAPVRKVFVGVEMDPALPAPVAGWDYFPNLLLKARTENQYYSHWTGFQGELRLANDVVKSQAVVKWGDKIGLNGSDIISVDVSSPAATVFLWDSKYRSTTETLVQSPTFANAATREAAVNEAIRMIQTSTTLTDAVKLKAISNLENRNFTTVTVGSGGVAGKVTVKYCGNNPC